MSTASEDDDLEERYPDGEADVTCPYCGEGVTILLDAGGGRRQEYVEDCEVCCRPWLVRVEYVPSGAARVTLEPA